MQFADNSLSIELLVCIHVALEAEHCLGTGRWPSLAAGHLNLAAPTNTLSGSDHPHTSGASLTGSSAMVPSVPRVPMFCQGSWSKDSSKLPRRQKICPPTWFCLALPPEQTCTIDIMVVLRCWHDCHCCSALICYCRLRLLLRWWGTSSQTELL